MASSAPLAPEAELAATPTAAASRNDAAARRALEAFAIPLGALLVSLAVFALFLALAGADPFGVFASLYRGGFGSAYSWQNTLALAAPLMLTALCTALPARVGLIVIGAEGALVLSGLAAALAGIALIDSNRIVAIAGMSLAGMAMGALWIGGIGALRHYRGVNETISSLLLNYIAVAILSYLIVGPLRDPASLNHPSTFHIGEAHMLGSIGDTSVHYGLIFGLLACVLLWLVTRRTSFGFAAAIAGGNRRVAQLCGLPVGRLVVIVSAMGGAAAGLAGAIEVAAVHGRANSSLNAGYGYEGILIAFIARQHPLAIIPVAILFGGIRAASGLMQRDHDLPAATALVMQGIMFLVILAAESLYGRFALFRAKAPT